MRIKLTTMFWIILALAAFLQVAFPRHQETTAIPNAAAAPAAAALDRLQPRLQQP